MHGAVDVQAVGVIALILIAAVLSIELNISVAILEILAGLAAGIWFLGEGHSHQWLEFLANFGLIGLMFFAGFETDEELLRKYWRESLIIALSSYLIPLTATFLVTYFLFSFEFKAAAMVGIGLSTTSLALVYTILRERGALQAEWGQLLLASAMFVDVFCMLSLTLAFEGISWWAALALLPLAGTLLALPRLGNWVFSRYSGDLVELKTRFVLLMLLALVLVAESVGVHVALLAFVTGVVFSEMMQQHEILEEKLRSIIFGFMAPLFFFQAGASIELDNLRGSVLLFFAVMTVLVFGIKYAATYFPMRRIAGKPLARLAALAFNYQLSFSIIVASFGLREGVFSEAVYSAMMCVVLVTVVASSVLLRVLPHEI
ncbi:MAG: hypothetical protein KatS3mg115_1086 [Candidatus Poribacteria bacterium]|nr:MAG: hypothetical protein KatS3mg115_1086 [Candidatus Poribacteria bacterium]